jgi:antitoxin MazE
MIYIMAGCISKEIAMKVAKWGNSLAIRIPAEVAADLGFAEGDQVKIESKDGKLVAEKEITREEALKRVRALRGMIPAGYKFKRSDAYEDDEY